MDTLTMMPSHATASQIQPRVLRAQFGDGYIQETNDGINPMLRKWQMVYANIAATGTTGITLKLLNDFFTAQAGYKKFLWTQPFPFDTEGPKMFVCIEWSFVYEGGLVASLNASIEQRADN